MSSFKSLKNVLPKRTYREREQPEWRKNKGFLEKKKDYLKRSKRYHQTQDQLSNFRQKASLKNPEQFVHKMINAQMEGGDIINLGTREDRENFDENEYRKILKTQNQGMVKYQKYRLSKFAFLHF
jgi:U3 small nucleolar RNA-associated protein 11